MKKVLIGTIAIMVTLIWGFFFFVSSTFAEICLKEIVDPQEKLYYCDLASETTLSRYVDYRAYARIELERAILLAEAGDVEESVATLQALFQWVPTDKIRLDGLDGTAKWGADRIPYALSSRIQDLDRDSTAFRLIAREFGLQEGT